MDVTSHQDHSPDYDLLLGDESSPKARRQSLFSHALSTWKLRLVLAFLTASISLNAILLIKFVPHKTLASLAPVSRYGT